MSLLGCRRRVCTFLSPCCQHGDDKQSWRILTTTSPVEDCDESRRAGSSATQCRVPASVDNFNPDVGPKSRRSFRGWFKISLSDQDRFAGRDSVEEKMVVGPDEYEVRRGDSCSVSWSDGDTFGMDREKQTAILDQRIGMFNGHICVSHFATPTATGDDKRERMNHNHACSSAQGCFAPPSLLG